MRIANLLIIVLILLDPVAAISIDADFEDTHVPDEQVNKAIASGRSYILNQQNEDGYWMDDVISSSAPTTEFIILTKYMGQRDYEENISSAVNWLLKNQNEDGGWGFSKFNRSFGYTGVHSTLNHTARAVLALQLAGIDNNSTIIRRGQEYINSHGGIESFNWITKVDYLMFGKISIDKVNGPPIEIILTPTFYDIDRPTRLALAAYAIIQTSEQYPNGGLPPSKKVAIEAAKNYILKTQAKDGSWEGSVSETIYCVLALYKAGYSVDNQTIKLALDYVVNAQREDGSFRGFRWPTWDTTHATFALREAKLNPRHPKLVKAAEWLISIQNQDGGWPSDKYVGSATGETANVIKAFNKVNLRKKNSFKNNCLNKGIEYLFNMQNNDGGWPTFEKNNSRDPSSPDYTSYVLQALAESGYDYNNSLAFQNAAKWLQQTQTENGTWLGSWFYGYTYGTSQVIIALNVIENKKSKEIDLNLKKSIDWFKAHQNSDGGWGEDYLVLTDPKYAGIGNSTIEQTSWILIALLEAGEEPKDPGIQKGIDFLIKHQNSDGSWNSSYVGYNGAGGIGTTDSLYSNTMIQNALPLIALSKYREYIECDDCKESE